MSNILHHLFRPASCETIELTLLMLRVSLGILTIIHGWPKIVGGITTWNYLGTFMQSVRIYFWPLLWGFLGASTEFFGGIMLTLGLGTRLASLALVVMMIVATAWHIDRGDAFMLYSFPLTLVFVYLAFVIIGSGSYSLDHYLSKR
jgi:putative oxidoreductase